MHCGMCLPTCPTYDATKRERNSPRGRIALMRAVADGDLDVTRELAEEMSYCLGCLACQTACPAGVNYAELFETARSDIETRAPTPASSGSSGARSRSASSSCIPARFGPPGGCCARINGPASRPWCGDPVSSGSCRRRCGGSSRRRPAWRRRSRTRSSPRAKTPEGPAQYRVALSPAAFRTSRSPTSTAIPPTCCSPTAASS